MAVTTFDKPVGTEIKTLSDQITTLSGRFATVNGTSPSVTDEDRFLVSFPSGFNETNCVVVGSMVKYSDNKWYSNFDGNVISTNDQGVWMKVHESGFCSRSAKAVLMKL